VSGQFRVRHRRTGRRPSDQRWKRSRAGDPSRAISTARAFAPRRMPRASPFRARGCERKGRVTPGREPPPAL
jgi:hypothetical protein